MNKTRAANILFIHIKLVIDNKEFIQHNNVIIKPSIRILITYLYKNLNLILNIKLMVKIIDKRNVKVL